MSSATTRNCACAVHPPGTPRGTPRAAVLKGTLHTADQRLAASLASGNATWAAPITDLGVLGAFGAAPTQAGDIRTTKTQQCAAYGPMSSHLGHTTRHTRIHGAWNGRCVGGHLRAPKGGHMTCPVQLRMCGAPTRHTMRHTTRFGALDRIARRRSAPSGAGGLRQRRAGRPKLQDFGGLWGGLSGRRLHARATSEPLHRGLVGRRGP